MLALDAMGGDNAPHEVCKGAILACREHGDLEIALVGDAPRIEPLLETADSRERRRIHVIHAEEQILMDEMPAVAIRKKRRSSLRIAMEMVRSREATGCVSAGSTGAIVAGGVLVVGRIPGIDRPGLGVPLPAKKKTTLLIDVGATVRCKPLNLYQFAIVGEVYMRTICGVEKPEIGLLSNGEEEMKGDDVTAEARDMLRNSPHNFIGYIEGKDIPAGDIDVVVCDGFTGNALLKAMEGVGRVAYDLLKEEMARRFLPKIGILFMLPMLKDMWKRFDYERQGGSPLLGVDGAVIKAHGRSRAPAIASALRVAREFVAHRGVDRIREEILQGRSE